MASYLKTCVYKLIETNLRYTENVRLYARWSHRRPKRVLAPEGYTEVETKDVKKVSARENEVKIDSARTKINWKRPIQSNIKPNTNLITEEDLDLKPRNSRNKPVKKHAPPVQKKVTVDMLETVIDADGNFIYTKMDNNDPIIGSLMVTVKSRKEQLKKDLILLEGKRLVKDALTAGCSLKYLIFSRTKEVDEIKSSLPKSGAKLYKMPYREMQMWTDLTTSPGIMGIFKVPDVENFIPEKDCLPLTIICDNIREPGNLGAVLRAAAGVGCEKVILTPGCVDLWDTKVLRSACGAHFRQQIRRKVAWSDMQNLLVPTVNMFIADNKVVSGDFDTDVSRNEFLTKLLESVPIIPYYGIDFKSCSSIAVIVGGETEGISQDSYKLAESRGGVRLNIPINNDIDSLNTGTALGIIIFEIKRQLAIKRREENIEQRAAG